MFEFFIRNDLISQNQSGFKPGDSCINQLLAISHEMYKSFDACLDVRAVFLDMSKAFDKVWHEGHYHSSRLWRYDLIYDEAFNNSFHHKIESLQYNAALATIGAITGTSREKIYQELV